LEDAYGKTEGGDGLKGAKGVKNERPFFSGAVISRTEGKSSFRAFSTEDEEVVLRLVGQWWNSIETGQCELYEQKARGWYGRISGGVQNE